jgi:hypothetical protein
MQTIESKNKNILNRFETKEPVGKLKSFLISVNGKKMSYLSRTCKSKDEAIIAMKHQFPTKKVKFIE